MKKGTLYIALMMGIVLLFTMLIQAQQVKNSNKEYIDILYNVFNTDTIMYDYVLEIKEANELTITNTGELIKLGQTFRDSSTHYIHVRDSSYSLRIDHLNKIVSLLNLSKISNQEHINEQNVGFDISDSMINNYSTITTKDEGKSKLVNVAFEKNTNGIKALEMKYDHLTKRIISLDFSISALDQYGEYLPFEYKVAIKNIEKNINSPIQHKLSTIPYMTVKEGKVNYTKLKISKYEQHIYL